MSGINRVLPRKGELLRFVSQDVLETEGPFISEEGTADQSEGAMRREEEGLFCFLLFIALS